MRSDVHRCPSSGLPRGLAGSVESLFIHLSRAILRKSPTQACTLGDVLKTEVDEAESAPFVPRGGGQAPTSVYSVVSSSTVWQGDISSLRREPSTLPTHSADNLLIRRTPGSRDGTGLWA